MTNWEQHLQHTGWAKFLPWFSAFSLYGNKGLHHPDLAPLSPLPHLSYPKPTPLIPGDCIWGEGTIFHCRPPMLTELFLFLIFTFTMGKYSLLLLPLPPTCAYPSLLPGLSYFLLFCLFSSVNLSWPHFALPNQVSGVSGHCTVPTHPMEMALHRITEALPTAREPHFCAHTQISWHCPTYWTNKGPAISWHVVLGCPPPSPQLPPPP